MCARSWVAPLNARLCVSRSVSIEKFVVSDDSVFTVVLWGFVHTEFRLYIVPFVLSVVFPRVSRLPTKRRVRAKSLRRHMYIYADSYLHCQVSVVVTLL